MADVPLFRRGRLPEHPERWARFRKTKLTPAIRINGPFEVETDEGLMQCRDGWLALDQRGFPYPIDATEFENTYIPAEEA